MCMCVSLTHTHTHTHVIVARPDQPSYLYFMHFAASFNAGDAVTAATAMVRDKEGEEGEEGIINGCMHASVHIRCVTHTLSLSRSCYQDKDTVLLRGEAFVVDGNTGICKGDSI